MERQERLYWSAVRILRPIFIPFRYCLKVLGQENIIIKGPNIIVANHPGIGRDIASIVLTFPRRVYFLAAHYLFNEQKFLEEHIKPALGKVLFNLLYLFARQFARFLSRALRELEMIPIDRTYQKDRLKFVQNIRNSLEMVKRYLRCSRAVVIFPIQYDLLSVIAKRRVVRRPSSKYSAVLSNINSTVAKIAYELWRDFKINVPVTPVAIMRGEGLNPFRKVYVNVGKPLRIVDILKNFPEKNPIITFTDFIERNLGILADEITGFQREFGD